MRRTESARKSSSGSGTLTKAMRTPEASKTTQRRFVVCLHNAGYPASLELHKIYRVLPDADAEKHGDIRIVDESGEDYLHPADWFAAIEVPEPVAASLAKAS